MINGLKTIPTSTENLDGNPERPASKTLFVLNRVLVLKGESSGNDIVRGRKSEQVRGKKCGEKCTQFRKTGKKEEEEFDRKGKNNGW